MKMSAEDRAIKPREVWDALDEVPEHQREAMRIEWGAQDARERIAEGRPLPGDEKTVRVHFGIVDPDKYAAFKKAVTSPEGWRASTNEEGS